MRLRLSGMPVVLVGLASMAGCGGGGGSGGSGTGPDPSILTSLEITPASRTLFSIAPGNTAKLAVVAKDQNGAVMTGVEQPTFSSGNDAVATVGSDGTVTAAGVGTTQITASVTAGEVTETATATITVKAAPATATVTAFELAFLPDTADVSAGGTVTWTFGPLIHTVTFRSGGSPPNVPVTNNGSVTRVFPGSGTFRYQCEIHPVMQAVVRVH